MATAQYLTSNDPNNTILLDTEAIRAGDIVLTSFGWWGYIYRAKINSRGVTGYSTIMLYRASNGKWLAPRNVSRQWIWDCDVEAVLPR